MKKRSLGVVIFGWMFILGGLSGFISRINFQRSIELLGGGLTAYLVYILSVSISVASFIGGIYVLKLETWARKLVIAVCLVNIIYTPFLTKIAVNLAAGSGMEAYYSEQEARIMKEIKPEYQREALDELENSKRETSQALPRFFVLVGAATIFWNIFVIYFFRRQKVKAQFEQGGEGCCAAV